MSQGRLGFDGDEFVDRLRLGLHRRGRACGRHGFGAPEKHPDLAGSRFHASRLTISPTAPRGNRYPQNTGTTSSTGAFTPESEVPADGNWDQKFNDSHWHAVTGTVGGNRDGSEFHGVAFGADVHVANTGGNDNTNYGPFQDPKFFYMTWNKTAEELNTANDDRGGFINNSFGTNTRIVDRKTTGPDGAARACISPSTRSSGSSTSTSSSRSTRPR